jgi:hypothetical protein
MALIHSPSPGIWFLITPPLDFCGLFHPSPWIFKAFFTPRSPLPWVFYCPQLPSCAENKCNLIYLPFTGIPSKPELLPLLFIVDFPLYMHGKLVKKENTII